MSDNFDTLLNQLDRLFVDQRSDSAVTGNDQQRPQNVAHYQLGRVLGSGGFGVVYLAKDTELNRLVALKLPRLEALFDKEKRSRFAAEAMTAARLNHPGIVQVHEADLDGMMPFIASEFCDGPNLAQWLEATDAPPPWQQCLALVADVADAVQYAHRNNVFHRDLKPANIMVTLKGEDRSGQPAAKGGPNGRDSDSSADAPVAFASWELKHCRARLTDFGLAKLIDSSLTETRTSQMMGTPLYMAPEQLGQDGTEKPNAAIDIYALGVILFELLTGCMPIDGSSYVSTIDNIRTMRPLRLSEFRRGLPRDVERITAKCLEKNPNARYASAGELAEDLRRCAQGLPVLGKRVGVLSRLAWWCTRPQRVATAGWFVISWVSLMAVWILFNILAMPAHQLVPVSEYMASVRDLCILMVLGVAPAVWLGAKTVQGKTWALWAIVVYSVVRLPLLAKAMVAEPVYFAMVYRDNPLFSFVDHSMMVIATMIQLFLCCCGLLAKKKMVQYLKER